MNTRGGTAYYRPYNIALDLAMTVNPKYSLQAKT